MVRIYGSPMSVSDFHLLPRKLGWRHEYDSGEAVIMPADITIDVHLPVSWPAPAGSLHDLRLCSVEDEQAFALCDLYTDAFRPTTEAFGSDEEDLRAEAEFQMILYASGACGRPMRCSRVEVDGETPVAALLVAADESGPRISTLIVHPAYQRRGIATGLLTEVVAWLARHRYTDLYSRYYLSNEASKSWYRKMGFIERPDSDAVEHCRHFYHYEVARLRSNTDAHPDELRRAEEELAKWNGLAAGMGNDR